MNTAQRKIFAAHQKAGSYCNQGLTPTAALVKSANDHDLNPEMTRRVSEMLNISLTQAFMKSAKDKTASFPLADSEAAIKQVFSAPAAAKTASAESFGELTIKRAAQEEHPFFKVAREENRGNINDIVQQAEGARQELKHELSLAKQAKLAAQSDSLDKYSALISHFRGSANMADYAEFEHQCYADYGDKVAHYLDAIYVHLNEGTERGDNEFGKVAYYFKAGPENVLFDELMESIGAMEKAAADEEQSKVVLADFELKIEEFYRKTANVDAKPVSKVAHFLDFKKKAFGLAGQQLIHDPLTAAVSAQEQGAADSYGKGLQAEQDRIYKGPKDQSDMEMDNVRRQAILLDLMHNDEVISGQDPKHVQSAYNTLLSISPKTTLQREVVRSVLRNATAQQAVDPFTAKQLADLEGQHLKNKNIADGKPVPVQ